MRRLDPFLAPAGYSPRRYETLSPAPVNGMGERLTDLRDLQALFANGEQGGYWPADPAYAFEDSVGTLAASVNGVVGNRTDVALGKHAVQATTANKPYLRCTPTTGKYWYDSNTSTGALTATFSGSLGSACTIASVTPEGVSILDNQTVDSAYNICPPYGYNADVLIINRALTAAEKALVTRVMQRNVPMLGSELVTNGGFDTNLSGWTISATDGSNTITWDSGAVKMVGTGSVGMQFYQDYPGSTGLFYYGVTGVTVLSGTNPKYIISLTIEKSLPSGINKFAFRKYYTNVKISRYAPGLATDALIHSTSVKAII